VCLTCNCLKRDQFYILLQELCNNTFCHILVKSVFYTCRSINSGGEELCVIVVNSTTFGLYSLSFERHMLLAEYTGSDTYLCLVFFFLLSRKMQDSKRNVLTISFWVAIFCTSFSGNSFLFQNYFTSLTGDGLKNAFVQVVVQLLAVTTTEIEGRSENRFVWSIIL
jgi:hypothetical protein